jgi:transposase-like protein
MRLMITVVGYMVECKHCGSENFVKDGFVKGKQRYCCKECKRTFRSGDGREKYSIEQKIKAIKLYTDGVGMRSIERSEGVSVSLLIHWIRSFGSMIKEKISQTTIPNDVKAIAILEADELFTFYQKKHKKLTFGLLWTETGIKLLIL